MTGDAMQTQAQAACPVCKNRRPAKDSCEFCRFSGFVIVEGGARWVYEPGHEPRLVDS